MTGDHSVRDMSFLALQHSLSSYNAAGDLQRSLCAGSYSVNPCSRVLFVDTERKWYLFSVSFIGSP